MKRLFLSLFAVLISLSAFSQQIGLGLREYIQTQKTKSSYGIPEKYSLREINGKQYLATIIEANDDFNRSTFEAIGCLIGSKVGHCYTLYIPAEKVQDVLSQRGIKDIEIARKITTPMMNKAANDVNADLVWQGENLPQGYSGRDVIVGVTDWGFDYTDPMFFDTTYANYRVIAAWDQYRRGGNPPQGFFYGREIAGRDSLLAVGCDTSNVYKYGYHATHVSSIAAGSGAGTKYKGIAQEASLLMCTLKVDESAVIDAYAWMRDKARALGKRLVINGSWGLYHWGVLDGTSLLDKVIDSLSLNDSIVFVSSAGNCGDYKFHLKAHFTNGDTVKAGVNFDTQRNTENYWGQSITMAGDSTNAFSSRLEFYNSMMQLVDSTSWVSTVGNGTLSDSMLVLNNDTIIYRVTSVASYGLNGRPTQSWSVRETKYKTLDHYVKLAITSPAGNVHCWNVASLTTGVGNWGLDFVRYDLTDLVGDNNNGVGEPTIANSMISVGAYASRPRNSYTGGTIAAFSSIGPRIDGMLKPDISAPGVNVVTTVSSFATEDFSSNPSITYNGRNYPLAPLSGTSMSSPVVTGIVALMLQANPNLTPAQIKTIIQSTARQDELTGSLLPDNQWGYGKIDALAAVQGALALVSLPQELNINETISVYPNPANNVFVVHSSKAIKTISIYNVLGKRVIDLSYSENNSGIFDKKIDISSLPKGIYVMESVLNGSIYRTKIVKD